MVKKIYISRDIFDKLKFILEDADHERVEEENNASVLVLPYRTINTYLSLKSNIPKIFVATTAEDLEVFKTLKNATFSLSEIKLQEHYSLLKIGRIGIEPNDEEIHADKREIIGLKRNNIIFSFIYITEFHRKIVISQIKDIFKKFINAVGLEHHTFPRYSKKTWSSIQRALNFIFAYNNPIPTTEFLRIAECDSLDEWVKDFIRLGILIENDETINLSANSKEILEDLKSKWNELKLILEGDI